MSVVGVFALSGAANAALISDSSDDGAGQDLQSLFDNWITDDGGNDFDVNDEAQVNSNWETSASSGSFSKIVIEIAGNADDNTFGIFNPANPDERLSIFAGGDAAGESRIVEYHGGGEFEVYGSGVDPVTANLGGSVFGFYLQNSANESLLFFSNPDLNGGAVQMVAFQGGDGREADFYGNGSADWLSNEWILAWEDLPYAESDQDFNDFVVLVESVYPVPEPMTLGLLGLGLVGMGIAGRRNRKVAAA